MTTHNGHTTPRSPVVNGITMQEVTLNSDQQRQIEDQVANVMTSRLQWLQQAAGLDKRRSIDEECGFKTSDLTPEEYQSLVDDDPFAARANEVFPKEMWQVVPWIYDIEKTSLSSPFEKAFQDLAQSLRGEQSFLEMNNEIHPLWEYCIRADVLSGIGRYGAMVLGIDDGLPLSEPAKGVQEFGSISRSDGADQPASSLATSNHDRLPPYSLTMNAGSTATRKLTQIRVFSEANARISARESNRRSPRHGWPTMYQITFDEDYSAFDYNADPSTTTQDVHWTRVVHLTDTFENPSSSEVFAVPRNKPIRKVLQSFPKLLYGGAEGYWKACINLIVLETLPALGANARVNQTQVKDMMENVFNSLQRYAVGQGIQFKSIAPTVSDPTPHIEAHINTICIKKNIPVRVFKGSERGELASSQDDAAWNDRLKARQQTYATTRLIAPLIDRLILLGVLPMPKNKHYKIDWPDLTSETSGEKIATAQGVMTVLGTFIEKKVDTIMSPKDALTRVLWFDEEEADAILEDAATHQEDKLDTEIEQQKTRIDEGIAPNPTPPTDPTQQDSAAIDLARKIRPAQAPTENEMVEEGLFDYSEMEEITTLNAAQKKAKLSGGKWVILENGVRVYLKSGHVVVGPAPVKQAIEGGSKDGTPKGGTGKGSSAATSPQGGAGGSSLPSDPNALHKELAKKMPKLNNAEFEAAGEYISGAYNVINGALRAGRELKPGERGQKYLRDLESAIDRAPTLDQSITVHRGLRLDADKGAQFLDQVKRLAKNGGTMTDPAFASTTIDPSIAKTWVSSGGGSPVKVVLETQAKKGLYLGDSVGGTKEKEFLMQKGTKLKVHGVEERDGIHYVKVEQQL